MNEAEFEREWHFRQQNGLKESSLRQEYEQKVGELRTLPFLLRAEGKSDEQPEDHRIRIPADWESG